MDYGKAVMELEVGQSLVVPAELVYRIKLLAKAFKWKGTFSYEVVSTGTLVTRLTY